MQASRYWGMGLLLAVAVLLAAPAAAEQPVMVDIKRMSLETALKAARATLEACREEGVQVAVTVVDRGGHPQVVLRDVLAMDITVPISRQKAHTAMAFNSHTSALEGRFESPFSVGKLEGMIMSAGGVPIQAGGNIIAGIGVSGAPSGAIDEQCANAGVEAITADLEMGAF